jgi:hypothetical protein
MFWFRLQKAKEAEARVAATKRTEVARQAEATQQGEERRRQAAKADAESSFRTLLSEVVKDPNKRWIDVQVCCRCAPVSFWRSQNLFTRKGQQGTDAISDIAASCML